MLEHVHHRLVQCPHIRLVMSAKDHDSFCEGIRRNHGLVKGYQSISEILIIIEASPYISTEEASQQVLLALQSAGLNIGKSTVQEVDPNDD